MKKTVTHGPQEEGAHHITGGHTGSTRAQNERVGNKSKASIVVSEEKNRQGRVNRLRIG